MRLLVGHDGRDGGRDALELARVLAEPEPVASAVVATVLSSGPLPMEYALLPEEEVHEEDPIAEEAREVLAGIAVETRTYGGGSAAGILHALAEREDPDVIVVGSPHRGTLGRIMLGSVAESLLNGAPADVVVAPAGYGQFRHEAMRTIAVGYDGTPEAKLALQRAEMHARRSRAAIKLITVVRPPVAAPVAVPGAHVPVAPPDPAKVIDRGLESVDTALRAESVRLEGDPAEELLDACEDGVDLLAVGSRSYGPLTRVLLGSVSRRVIRRAACPVLATRRP